jgi:GntR family transcriptional regulator
MTRIDPNSPVPIFRQIADGLRGEVAAGVYRPGDRIPSIRQLSAALLVNVNTVQRAYEQLEREGLIVNKRGTGMIVATESASAARGGVEGDVAAAFAQTITMARAARLPRAAVDALYRQAWALAAGRSDHEPTAR